MLLLRAPWRARFPRSPLGVFSLAAAAVVLAAFAGMLVPALQPQRGLVQRAAESALFGWLLLASLDLRGGASALPAAVSSVPVAD